MQIVLEKPEFEQFIKDKVCGGEYSSPTAVIEAALSRLMTDDFEPGELARLVAEGEASLLKYGPLKAEDVFRELRQLRNPARLKAGK